MISPMDISFAPSFVSMSQISLAAPFNRKYLPVEKSIMTFSPDKSVTSNMIKEWLAAEEPTEEDEMDDLKILYLLTQCAKAQNALDVARKSN